ncbi:hypothetical protein OJ997_16690 [Solirubrobacter phytolaccae]|uniref:Uncharacterized protein n=1 Tax=Solirubrobacter phytolaccae TaxID=1404360 RepID=A0A9X3N8V1_9ACTN|nr:hypothetical protein [Solirubrobacter phytolaccae]MDA0181943.1 hypothetical protein [Solirubrobacter phytolaccae]
MHTVELLRPSEVFPAWPRAQHHAQLYARETPPARHVLRTTGFLAPEHADRVAEWFLAPDAPPTADVRRAYRALEDESVLLLALVRECLGVRVRYATEEPYASASDLCSDLREHGSMTLVREASHPVLSAAGFDALRVVHDVLGHAALGVGFDLQSEFATWLQCRTLFSPAARPAAFCELVGAVTAYVVTGEKPGLRAKLPPAGLLGD